MLREFLSTCKVAYRRRRFRAGAALTRFVARDIRRDVVVVDASDVPQGFVVAKVRTWNVLYASKGIAPKPEFSEPTRLNLSDLWDWKGALWGGPVPDEESKKKA
jgi:hypothetical protein